MIERYTIGELLNKYTLFVPEIQRDYVWGAAENYKEVLLPFIQALNSNLKGDKSYYRFSLFLYTFKSRKLCYRRTAKVYDNCSPALCLVR